MLPELGLFFLIVSLFFSGLQCLTGSGWLSQSLQMGFTITRRAAYLASFSVMLSFFILIVNFASDDFSVRYVAEHSYTALPLLYKLTAAWGGHEGSLLLWIFIFALMSLLFLIHTRLDRKIKNQALSFLGLVHFSFVLFVIASSNPFARTFPGVPKEGLDLNPFLQDPLFVIHPPLLYVGYVGFAFIFSVILSILVNQNRDASAWVAVRFWSLLSFMGLTLGITLGSFWAYYELGWGGWWYWDPVENAAFMPWLLSVALIHAVMAAIQRQSLQHWTAILGLSGFLLSLLGTFLVRSGVLVSVHAFASDPQRGFFILLLLTFFVFMALFVYFKNSPVLKDNPQEALFSREFSFRMMSGLLGSSAAVVLVGTVYPLILEVLDWGKISVGPPYFNQMILPLFIPLLLGMGFGPSTVWLRSVPKSSLRVLIPGLLLTLLIPLVGWFVQHQGGWKVQWTFFLGLAMVFWLVGSVLPYFKQRKHRAVWGMVCGHLGIAAVVLGITVVTHFQKEKDVAMNPGDEIQLGPYLFRLDHVEQKNGPNYEGFRAEVNVLDLQNHELKSLYPERRVYVAQRMPISETALDGNLVRDLYVALSEQREDRSFAMRFYYKPMVRWIWLGALSIALGGLLSFWKRRVP